MDDNTKRIEPSAKRMPRIIQDDQWVSVEIDDGITTTCPLEMLDRYTLIKMLTGQAAWRWEDRE